MHVFRSFPLVAVLVLFASPLAEATHYKLFVLTGQSNSLGTTLGGEADPSPGTDAADTKVPFFWSNYDGSGTFIGDSGGMFIDLQDQQGSGANPTFWGPEIEFARSLYRAGGRDFGVIKASRGGGGNSNWVKGSGAMYTNVVNAVNAATATLTTGGHTFEIVGLLYLQGESDNSSEAAAAGTRAKDLVDNLRGDLPNASSMHMVIGGIASTGASDDTTRANQAAIAASTAYIDYFENLDLQSQLYDNLHFDKPAKITVGQRYAQEFFGAGVVSRHYGKLVFIGDSITQGGNGNPSYRYRVFENLANQGVPINASAGYKFVGSVSGAYASNPGSTPAVNGQPFENNHDGHWGWRAFWENGRVALPSGRRGSNRGEGTILNWTGQASPQEYDISSPTDTVDFPDLTTSGTGVPNPYTPYTPDTAVIMIGINDLGTSSPTQVRDDIGTMIDQLQAANANISIHLSQLLYTDQGTAAQANVDSTNALLPALAAGKTTATSPVWVIDTNNGFDPGAMTYDDVHPNATGEDYVGDRIAGGLGVIQMPTVTTGGGGGPLTIEEKASDALGCVESEGSEIWNTGSYVNDWSSSGGFTATAVGDSDLRIATASPTTSGGTLEGTNTGWSDINDGPWTVEARLKFDANPNGFILWMGTGTHRILIEVYGDRTQDYGADPGGFNVAHNNLDGEFHTFRVTHDPSADVYHAWRDDVLLTPLAGAPYDQTGTDERLLFGDYTGSETNPFGNGFDVVVDYINYCGGFAGNEIYDGTSFINGWANVNSINPSLVNTDDLHLLNTETTKGAWLDGTNAGWSGLCDGVWTMEARMKFDVGDNPNGFVIWLGTVDDRILIDVYADRTEGRGGWSSDPHDNDDGQFHTFRVGHDPDAGVYHVWRDGERLTPITGASYDATTNDNRMIFGDSTSGSFGNAFEVTIDYIRTDTGNVYLPVGADADGDGMSDLFEDTWFGDITAGDPNGNEDGDGTTNLGEYIADTNPVDPASWFRIGSIEWASPGLCTITVPDTSPQRFYTLFASEDLGVSDPWTAVPGQGPVIGTDGDLLLQESSTDAGRFYRVGVELP